MESSRWSVRHSTLVNNFRMGGRFVGHKSKYVSATTATWLVCLAVCMTGVLTQVQAQFSMSDIYNITEVDDVQKWCYDYGIDPNKLSISIETANKEYEPIKDKYSGFRATLDIIINNRTSKEDASKAKRDLVLKSQAGAMIIIGALGLLSLLIILIWGIWVLARRGHCCCKKAEAIVDNEPLTFKEILSKWKGKLVIGSTSVLFVATAVFAILWTIEAQSLGTRVKEVRCAAAVFYSDATGGKRVQVEPTKSFFGTRGFLATFDAIRKELKDISKINAAATKLATNFPQLETQSGSLLSAFQSFQSGFSVPTYQNPDNPSSSITPTVFGNLQTSIQNNSLKVHAEALAAAGTSVSTSLKPASLGPLASTTQAAGIEETLANKTRMLLNVTDQLLTGKFIPAFNESLGAEAITTYNTVLTISVCTLVYVLFPGAAFVLYKYGLGSGLPNWIRPTLLAIPASLVLLGSLLLFYSSGLYLATVGAYWGCNHTNSWLNTRDSWFNGMGYLLKYQEFTPIVNECIYKGGAGQFLNAIALDISGTLSNYTSPNVVTSANNLVTGSNLVNNYLRQSNPVQPILNQLDSILNGTLLDQHGDSGIFDQYYFVKKFNDKQCAKDVINMETQAPVPSYKCRGAAGFTSSSSDDNSDRVNLGNNFCFLMGNVKSSGYMTRYSTSVGTKCGDGDEISTTGQARLNAAFAATASIKGKILAFQQTAFKLYNSTTSDADSSVKAIASEFEVAAQAAQRINNTVQTVSSRLKDYATCNYLHVDTLRIQNTVCYGLSPNTDWTASHGFITGYLSVLLGSLVFFGFYLSEVAATDPSTGLSQELADHSIELHMSGR